MEEVQVGNSEESPVEEVSGTAETGELEATSEDQAEDQAIEVLSENQAADKAVEAELEEQAAGEESGAPLEEQHEGDAVDILPEEEPETALEAQSETEETGVPAEEHAGDTGAGLGVELQAGSVNGEVPSEAEDDQSEMGGIPVEDWDYQRPRRGEVRTGIILSIGEQEIIADVGAKRDGIVPYADMQRMGEEALAELRVGSEVPVYVLRPEDKEGNLLISLYMARQQQAWVHAQELADSGEIWEGEVIGYNKGGLVIPVEEIRGFIPASQVPGFPHGLSQEERLTRLSTMVGEKLPVKVIEINRRKRRLILSSTAAQQDWRKKARKELLDDLREGEVRTGTVSSLCSFGAFVDLGGADGLVHISELSWRRIRHPREVVSVGEEVEVYVLRLDHERQRIGLSLKRLMPEPWSLVEDKYELGQLVEGVVTNVVDFGAFAEVEEGVEGLIHVSELAEAPISHPRDVVKKGDLLLLRVIRIDTRRKRLGLSLKRVLESEWSEWAARLAAAEMEKKAAAEEAAEADVGPAAEEPVEKPEAEEAEEVTEAQEEPVAEAMAEAVDADEEAIEEPVEEPEAEEAEEATEAQEELVAEAMAEAVDADEEAIEEPVEEPEAEEAEEATEAEGEPAAEADEQAIEEPVSEPGAEEVAAEVAEEAAEAEEESLDEPEVEAAGEVAEAAVDEEPTEDPEPAAMQG